MRRRTWILSALGATGALVVGWGILPPRSRLGAPETMLPTAGDVALNGWIKIAQDGSVVLAMPRSEMGQGVHTGLAMLVAMPIQVGLTLRTHGRARAILPDQWGLVTVAGTLCAGSFLFYLQALTLEGAGVMATLRNTSIVFAVLFSRALGERPSPRQWAGAALIVAGAVGLAWPG